MTADLNIVTLPAFATPRIPERRRLKASRWAHLCVIALIATGLPHTPAAAQVQTDVEKQLAGLQADFAASYDRDVAKSHAAKIADLDARYVAAIDRALAMATKGGNLDDALALRQEIQRVKQNEPLPATDAATDPKSLKDLRITYRLSLARFNAEADKLAAPLLAKFDKTLAAMQELLTKAGKLDDAVRVKTERQDVAKRGTAGGSPAVAGKEPNVAAPPTGPASPPSPIAPRSTVKADPTISREVAEFALSKGGDLEILDGSKRSKIPPGTKLPAGRWQLVGIHFGFGAAGQLTDDDLIQFARVSELEALKLDVARNITSRSLAQIAALPQLMVLALPMASISDEDFKVFTNHSNIQTIQVHGTRITAQGLLRLRKSADSLTAISFGQPNRALDGETALLAGTFRKLRSLYVNAQMNAQSLSALSSLTDLNIVTFHQSDLSDSHVETLALVHGKAPSLIRLTFLKCTLSDSAWLKLGDLGWLTELKLDGMMIPDEALARFGTLRKLTKLEVTSSPQPLPDDKVAALRKALPKCQIMVK